MHEPGNADPTVTQSQFQSATSPVMPDPPIDEMVDGGGGVRPHWRQLLGVMTGLGPEELRLRAAALNAALAEEGISALSPGTAEHEWRCDALPLPIPASEFAVLESGLAQRASLLERLLADLYGPRTLLEEGVLPASLLWPNPGYLRACEDLPGRPRLHLYAADLVRGANGVWHVLADRTEAGNGIAYALENRRMMARMLPELFAPHLVMPLRPFLDSWEDTLRALLPAGAESAGVGLLTPGSGDPYWAEHVLMARELSATLVEGGDLTVRGGALFLKTLRGLRPIGLLLNRQDGDQIDPLELAAGSAHGVPGLLDAMRAGSVRVLNHPGARLVESPGIAAFLPALAQRLLGEELILPSVGAVWLGDPDALARVRQQPRSWWLRPALDGRAAPVNLAALAPARRDALMARVAADPGSYAALAAMGFSAAPCVAPVGLEPRPIVLRLFLVSDGQGWRIMPGGLARALGPDDPLAGRLPTRALSKDVWVLAEQGASLIGPAVPAAPVLVIRRTAGDLPSRVADNFYWLGRYLERLESAARLLRAAVSRIVRAAPTPRELAELEVLGACMAGIELVPAGTDAALGAGSLAQAVLAALRGQGRMVLLLGQVGRIAELLRDRMTDEMHATMSGGVRALRESLRGQAVRPYHSPRDEHHALEEAAVWLQRALELSAAMSGLIAENMVRGGGRLFVDLGRRIERAQAIAVEVAAALEPPERADGARAEAGRVEAGRVEAGLRLVLELRDSVLTYRNRYLGVMQPAPALDLVLADAGNPRGLAFQLSDATQLLTAIAGESEVSFAPEMATLLARAEALVRDVQRAPDQAEAAAGLPPALRALSGLIGALSDDVSRHYFSLLPATRTVGVDALAIDAGGDGLLGAA